MRFDETKYIDAIYSSVTAAEIHNTEWKNTLVIGDVHFGVKNNSVTWLDKQVEFFEKQVYPIIKKAKELNISDVVFLGDMFDIRASTNTVTGLAAKQVMRQLDEAANKNNVYIYVIAGNHDFYSPDEKYKDNNTYELVFGDEFLDVHSNITIIEEDIGFLPKRNNKYECIGNAVLLPWYETEIKEKFIDNLNYIYKYGVDVSSDAAKCYGVYTHCDLTHKLFDTEISSAFNRLNIPFWTGHIHYVATDSKRKIYNVGACMQYNYGDADQDRFIYIINEKENKKVSIKNIITPKFAIINENIMFDDNEIRKYAETEYIELSILNTNINKSKYVERIKEIRNMLSNSDIRIRSMFCDDDNDSNSQNSTKIYTNIEAYINENVPEKLQPHLKEIRDVVVSGTEN